MIRMLGVGIFAIAAGFEAHAATPTGQRTMLQRDTEGFAIASCLAHQSEPLLRDQGGAWAGAIVQRSRGSVEAFTAIAHAVEVELKNRPVSVGRDDRTGRDRSLPVLHCGEIIDVDTIRMAIARAETALAKDYRKKPLDW